MDWSYIGTLLLLIFGFGFVIFWHELGHFLAAKWAGVKVEQFAVGFGQAMLSWRKGLGLRWGSSRQEYEKKLRDYLQAQDSAHKSPEELAELTGDEQKLDYAAAQLGLGETEYRLNWIPLGGYVKMLGQDDMNPNALSESPRAYNNKPISKRMVIVSAGVVMNVILAIIFFTILFRIGFDVPPAVVGAVAPGSPAQQAGIKVGDRIVKFDGRIQHDFTKISLNTALVEEGQPVPILVRQPDGTERTLTATPKRAPGDPSGFLKLGVEPSPQLTGLDPKKLPKDWEKDRALWPTDSFAVMPGEKITAVEGKPVKIDQYYVLDRALQDAYGKPVTLTVENPAGQTRDVQITPVFFDPPLGFEHLNFAGMVPRSSIISIIDESSAVGKLQPGDDIISLTIKSTGDTSYNPSPDELRQKLSDAGKANSAVDMTVLRDGKEVTVSGLTAEVKLEGGGRGLGVAPGYDADHPVVGAIDKDSAAARASIPTGATIVSVDGQPVKSWYDVHRVLRQITSPTTVPVVARTAAGEKTHDLELSESDINSIDSVRYTSMLMLHELSDPRKTKNPIQAAKWGVIETRDLMVQFYLTIRRMFQGSVPASGAMGPIGIFHQGSKIAYRGTDWLIWFLAMISANLAVVNFLPIPIVDGGLFVFLILEKIMRRPLSPRAQSIAQLVGLALIASVFLFVTYHDVLRMF